MHTGLVPDKRDAYRRFAGSNELVFGAINKDWVVLVPDENLGIGAIDFLTNVRPK